MRKLIALVANIFAGLNLKKLRARINKDKMIAVAAVVALVAICVAIFH